MTPSHMLGLLHWVIQDWWGVKYQGMWLKYFNINFVLTSHKYRQKPPSCKCTNFCKQCPDQDGQHSHCSGGFPCAPGNLSQGSCISELQQHGWHSWCPDFIYVKSYIMNCFSGKMYMPWNTQILTVCLNDCGQMQTPCNPQLYWDTKYLSPQKVL